MMISRFLGRRLALSFVIRGRARKLTFSEDGSYFRDLRCEVETVLTVFSPQDWLI